MILRNTLVFAESDNQYTVVLHWTKDGVYTHIFHESHDVANAPRCTVSQELFDQIARLDKPKTAAEFDYYVGQRLKSRDRMAMMLAHEALAQYKWLKLPGTMELALKDAVLKQMPAGSREKALDIIRAKSPRFEQHEHDRVKDILPWQDVESELRRVKVELADEIKEQL